MNIYLFASSFSEEIINSYNTSFNKKIIVEKAHIDQKNLNPKNLIIEDLSYDNQNFIESYNYIKVNIKQFKDLILNEIQIHYKSININLISSSVEFWLLHYISTIKIRYEKLIYLKNKYKNISLPRVQYNKIEFLDTSDFINQVELEESINCIIFEKIGEILGIDFFPINNKKKCGTKKKKAGIFFYIKKKLFRFILSNFKLNVNFDVYTIKKKITKIYEFVNLKKIYLSSEVLKIESSKSYSNFFGNNLNNQKNNLEKNDLNYILLELLPFFLPKIFYINLDLLIKDLEKIEKNIISLNSSIAISSSDEFRFLAEMCKSKKKNVITYQHGGLYTMQKYNLSDEFENKYTTFLDWKNKNSFNIFFKSFFYLKNINYESNKKILFFSAIKTINIVKYESELINFKSNKEKIVDSVNLYKNLKSTLKTIFEIRCQKHNYNWNYKRIFLQNLGEPFYGSFENQKNVQNVITTSRILIFDTISTIFFEALVAKIPFFLILKNDNFFFKNDIKKLINELITQKILFKNTKDCAHFINDNYNEIKDYWRSPGVNKVIEKLNNKFFYIDNNNLDKNYN